MREYKPKFDQKDYSLIILDNLFDAESCMNYAKQHNMKVLMTTTTSASSIETIMLFQKNGFTHKLYEEEVFAPGGLRLNPRVLCLFEKEKTS